MSKHVKVVLSCRNTFPHWNPKIGKLKVSPIWSHIVDINLTGFDENLKQSLLVKGTLIEQFVQQKKFLKLYFCSQLAVKFVWCLYIILCFILLLYLWYLCIVSSIIPLLIWLNIKNLPLKGEKSRIQNSSLLRTQSVRWLLIPSQALKEKPALVDSCCRLHVINGLQYVLSVRFLREYR